MLVLPLTNGNLLLQRIQVMRLALVAGNVPIHTELHALTCQNFCSVRQWYSYDHPSWTVVSRNPSGSRRLDSMGDWSYLLE